MQIGWSGMKIKIMEGNDDDDRNDEEENWKEEKETSCPNY